MDPSTIPKLVEIASRLVQQTGTTIGALRSDPAVNPMDVLLDLRLPKNLLDRISPILEALGFKCDESTLTFPFGEDRKIHRLQTNGGLELFLVYIPKWILERNGTIDKAAVDYIYHYFPAGTRVYLISEGVDVLKTAFEGQFATWRQAFNINVLLVPWA